MIVRAEIPEDAAQVRVVNESAFGGTVEADLVDALRESARPHISLVAVEGERVVGHIFFSTVMIESDDFPAADADSAMGLAPMAVLPESQGRGVGSRLVEEGLRESLRAGRALVFVLGHPTYYPRFGFVPASRKNFRCVYPVPDEVFMVTELRPGAADGLSGLVKYRPEFDGV